MTMMIGQAPFGKKRIGSFNFEVDSPEHVLFFEPFLKKVKAVVHGTTIAESTNIKLLHETGSQPTFYFPLADVAQEFLEATDHHTRCPFKGNASYYSITVDGETKENAAWTYPNPKKECPPIDGYVAFYWDAIDEWWEEAERIYVHPRDPYHRIDAVNTDRHVKVEVDGKTIAESSCATMLFETGLPPRFYIAEIDVDSSYLIPSDTQTACPYKGKTSRYYTISAGGEKVEDAVWVYDQPLDEVRKIAGKLAFYNEKVDLIVDGERWERPKTKLF